jgi:multiple sugar transport system substrate-binding protein
VLAGHPILGLRELALMTSEPRPPMRHPILYRWLSRVSPSLSRCSRAALLISAWAGVAGLPLSPANAQEAYREPDYSKFPAESGPITLEVWSWVSGLDKAAQLFEQAYPNIKVHVNNVGGGPGEYQKLQTAIKAGSGGPDVAQIEYDFLPSFIVTDGLADLSKYGANDAKGYFVPWTWTQVSPDGKAVYGIPQDIGPMALL